MRPHFHAPAATPVLPAVAASPAALERKPSVLRRTGLSNTALYSAMSRCEFPRPVSLGTGRAVAWVESEVSAWIVARVAERDTRASEASQ